MDLKFYELAGIDGRRLSPFSWRARFALAHKGIDAECIPVKFTEMEKIAFSGQDRVPILVAGDDVIFDSWKIALYLEETYTDRLKLFSSPTAMAIAHGFNNWVDTVLHPPLFRMIVLDIVEHTAPEDREHFRITREARLGKTLEEVQANRLTEAAAANDLMAPLRLVLETQPFLSGDEPSYGDHILGGTFQWLRSSSPFALLSADDPLHGWRERMLDLYGGLARKAVAYSN